MKSIGSEKIQNPDEKLERIKQIAGITNRVNEEKITHVGRPSDILHESVAANGKEYAIVQEQKYIYIKEKINDNYEYLSGIQNIKEHSYSSYSEALKHLNLMFKEINEMTGHVENVDILKKKA